MLLSEKKIKFKSYVTQYYRDYQFKSFQKTFDNNIGQFLFPTGTGKTRIQKYIHARETILKENNNMFATCVIVAHRLLLCRQLLSKLTQFFKLIGLEYEIIFVGSGGQNDIKGLLDKTSITKKVKYIKKRNKHVIIASTYHSLGKLEDLDKIDICTFDEAHNIVLDDPHKTGQFKTNIEKIKPIINKEFYFTATPKTFVDLSGKVDTTFFGDVLGWMSPRTAIYRKDIVEPALLIGETFREEGKDIDPNNKNVIVQSIIENFAYQETHSELAPKVLISFKNIQKDLVPVYNDRVLKKWCKKNNVTRLMFSSTKTGNRINDKKYKHISNEMLSELDKIKKDPTAKCLFMHYDVLSEGIDIPNMTGILLFRDLEKHELKFIQNVGRCCRSQTGKKYAYVSIPDYLLEEEKYKEIILQLYTSYDFKDFTDVKVFIGTKEGKGGGRSVKSYRDEEAKDLEIYQKLITFDFDVARKDLNASFGSITDIKEKEKFLLSLIDQAYPEDEIIEPTDIIEIENTDPPQDDTFLEGMEIKLKESSYHYRHPKAREICLQNHFKKYGFYMCLACGINTEEKFGEVIIEVHHPKQICEGEVETIAKELEPLCPTCHSAAHKRNPCFNAEQVKGMIKK